MCDSREPTRFFASSRCAETVKDHMEMSVEWRCGWGTPRSVSDHSCSLHKTALADRWLVWMLCGQLSVVSHLDFSVSSSGFGYEDDG